MIDVFLAVVLVVAVGVTAAGFLWIKPGFRGWQRADQVNYVVMVAATWPWIALGFFFDLPAWYSVTAVVVGVGSLVVFLTRSVLYLRRSGAELRRLRQELADTYGERD